MSRKAAGSGTRGSHFILWIVFRVIVGSSSNHIRIDYKQRSDRCLRPKSDFNLICAHKVLKCKSSSMDSFYRIVGSPKASWL